MSNLFLGLLVWCVLASVLLGWLLPLIVGVRRYRCGAGGKVLVGIGSAWCLLAVSLIGLCVWAGVSVARRAQAETFDRRAYTGAVGMLTLPFEGSGSLLLSHEGPEGAARRWNVSVSNGVAVVPAGALSIIHLNVSIKGAGDVAGGMLYCSFSGENRSVVLEANGQQRLPGGFPLVASVEAERQGERLSLNFRLEDAAGNKVVWYAGGAGRKPPAFEAVDASGKCFWRDNFEYG